MKTPVKLGRGSFTLPRKFTLDSLSEDSNLKFGRILSSISSIIAIVFLASIGTFSKEMKHLTALAQVADEAGLTVFSNLLLYVYLMITGGALVLLSAIIGFWSSHWNKKNLVIIHIFLSFLGAGLLFAGSILSGFFITDMAFILCEDKSCNPRDSSFTNQQLELVALEMGMFDECCLSRHKEWSDQVDEIFLNNPQYTPVNLFEERVQQESFGICHPSNPIANQCTGDTKIPAVISDVISSLPPLLCTCAPDNGQYDSVRAVLKKMNQSNSEGGCKALETAKITVDVDLKVPTTGLSFLTAVAGRYKDYFDEHPEERIEMTVPLIGSPSAPYIDEVFPNGGFGCGLGMTKGFFWYTAVFVDQSLRLFISIGFACAVVGTVTAVLMLVFLVMANRSTLDLLDYADDQYTLQSSVRPEVQVKMVQPSETSGPQRESGGSGASGSSGPSATQAEFHEMEARISAFYAKYEPSKLVDGRVHEDVVNYTLARGEEALNEKLRAKYGADLSTMVEDIDEDEDVEPPAKPNSVKKNILGEKIVNQKAVEDII